jgi:hypothetical protein
VLERGVMGVVIVTAVILAIWIPSANPCGTYNKGTCQPFVNRPHAALLGPAGMLERAVIAHRGFNAIMPRDESESSPPLHINGRMTDLIAAIL